MGQYSTIYDGKVLDWRFKRQSEDVSVFYLGKTIVGTIHKLPSGYAAVLYAPHPYNNVHGFKTRLSAADYLLRIGGYRNQ